MFLFWSIVGGVICGVDMAKIPIMLRIILTLGIVILNILPVIKAPMILVVNALNLDVENTIISVAKSYAKHSTVTSRNMVKTTLNLIFEMQINEGSC